jgi:hypothetical protein
MPYFARVSKLLVNRVQWSPFFKDHINSKENEKKAERMVPRKFFPPENANIDDHENQQRQGLLYGLQFEHIKWSAIANESKTVGGYLENIFEERDEPTDKNDTGKAKIPEPFDLLELKMAVPGERHENI